MLAIAAFYDYEIWKMDVVRGAQPLPGSPRETPM
jgi:hypothetical protein